MPENPEVFASKTFLIFRNPWSRVSVFCTVTVTTWSLVAIVTVAEGS